MFENSIFQYAKFENPRRLGKLGEEILDVHEASKTNSKEQKPQHQSFLSTNLGLNPLTTPKPIRMPYQKTQNRQISLPSHRA